MSDVSSAALRPGPAIPSTARALPWEHDPGRHGWDGYACGVAVAAETALQVAVQLLADELWAGGRDDATALHAANMAPPGELRRRLPPSLGDAARLRVELLLAQRDELASRGVWRWRAAS
jgi:hypothetical protein